MLRAKTVDTTPYVPNISTLLLYVTVPLVSFGFYLVARFIFCSEEERPSRVGSFFLGTMLISLFAITSFVVPSIMDTEANYRAEASTTPANTVSDDQLEITDEDYQFLVYSLLINENSIVGKEQARQVKQAFSDGFVSVKEFQSIPDLSTNDLSEAAISKLKIKVSEQMAKDLLLKMTQVAANE